MAPQPIGEMASRVWTQLSKQGMMTTRKLVQEMGAPRDDVQRAIGWLAREDKVVLQEMKGSETVALK